MFEVDSIGEDKRESRISSSFVYYFEKYVHFNSRKTLLYISSIHSSYSTYNPYSSLFSAKDYTSLSFQEKTYFKLSFMLEHSVLYDIISPPESRARPKQDSGIGTKRTPRPKLPF